LTTSAWVVHAWELLYLEVPFFSSFEESSAESAIGTIVVVAM
jgi:hypothetical protein